MPEIEIRDICFRYETGRQGRIILDHLDLRVEDGEFLCIIGVSGSGKSTLLRLLAGLESPESGSIRIDGKPITGTGADRMIVFQDYALFPWMNARRNISFAVRSTRRVSSREADQIAGFYLEQVGLANSEELYPFQLSGGMRQRVAIARALAMDTDILLLDEPFGAVDAKSRFQLQELLLSLWTNTEGKKKTVIFVTHDIGEAILLADRVAFLREGTIAEELSIRLPRPRAEEDFTPYREKLLALFERREETAREE